MLLTEMSLEYVKEAWMKEAREETRKEIARNALDEGASIEFIHKITGLDVETIERLVSEK